MSQPVEQIQALIIADVAAQPDLNYIDADGNSHNITENTSKRAKWRLWTFLVASAISLNQVLTDIFKTANETAIASAIPETTNWLVKKIFEFQYDATTPQVIQFINLLPTYLVVDPSLRIISRVAVVTTRNNQVLIKVATAEPPTALTVGQVSALQSYVTTIGVPGVNYKVVTSAADKLFIDADIYYTGQYAAVIQQSVIDALDNFLAALSSEKTFNGILKVSDVENLIRNVPGVTDAVVRNIRARKDATALADADYLVQSQTLISRLWPTISGYIVQETTAANTFADTLNFIPQ